MTLNGTLMEVIDGHVASLRNHLTTMQIMAEDESLRNSLAMKNNIKEMMLICSELGITALTAVGASLLISAGPKDSAEWLSCVMEDIAGRIADLSTKAVEDAPEEIISLLEKVRAAIAAAETKPN